LLFRGLTVLADEPDARALFVTHCAQCHGPDRLGLMGLALLPENLGRRSKKEDAETIRAGRPATQMPPCDEKLTRAQIDALVDYVCTPLSEVPTWGLAEITASHKVFKQSDELVKARSMSVTQELSGQRSASLTPESKAQRRAIASFIARAATLLSGARGVGRARKPLLRRVYNADPLNLFVAVEVGNHHATILDGDRLEPIHRFQTHFALHGGPLPVYNGPTHDYRMDEGVARVHGTFPVRRIRLDDYLDDFFFDQSYRLLIGAARNAKNGQVIQLDLGRKIADLELDGLPHLGSGITWKAEVSVIDLDTFKTIKRIPTLGPGFFMRSHEGSPYAWVNVFFGKDKGRDACDRQADSTEISAAAALAPPPRAGEAGRGCSVPATARGLPSPIPDRTP